MNDTNSCLIIIDMQKAFLDEGAMIQVPNGKRIIPEIINTIKHCRSKKIPIIWTKVNIETFEVTQYKDLFPNHFMGNKAITLNKNADDYSIVNELKDYVLPDDIVIEKDRYSAFLYTNLHLILKNKFNVKNIFFAGVSTNVCVESTIRDAFQLGYNCYLLSNCTATFDDKYQKLSEDIISFVFGKVINSNDIIK